MKTLLTFLLFICTLNISAQDIIQMEKVGGVYKVPCKINGLGLKFIFDTGASDVSISLSEAVFMVKNGYLNESDFRGTETYRIANGDIAEGTKVNLRKVEFGKQTLYNVEASIVHSMDAPLLLGQSVLQRLGKFSVDYSNNTMIVGGGSVVSKKSNSNSNTTSTTSSTTGTVTDINGKVYKTVKIGIQWWMAENLDVDKFRNGDPIPLVKSDAEWIKTGENKQPAWCYYDNDPANGSIYGKLYNWYVVADTRGLCPVGWHVPIDSEWNQLVKYLDPIADISIGGINFSGRFMKQVGNLQPASRFLEYPNIEVTNPSGFTGLTGGFREYDGEFYNITYNGSWWSSMDDTTNSRSERFATYRELWHDKDGLIYTYGIRAIGASIRCIKN